MLTYYIPIHVPRKIVARKQHRNVHFWLNTFEIYCPLLVSEKSLDNQQMLLFFCNNTRLT